MVTGSTVQAWFVAWVMAVKRYLIDDSGLSAGRQFLFDAGYHKLISNHCRARELTAFFPDLSCEDTLITSPVVLDHGLNRHLSPKVFWGRPELQILMGEALKNSENGTRWVKVQQITIMMILFHLGSRPSTLGPTTDQYKSRRQVSRFASIASFLFSSAFYCSI
jgi:hypothetical protein